MTVARLVLAGLEGVRVVQQRPRRPEDVHAITIAVWRFEALASRTNNVIANFHAIMRGRVCEDIAHDQVRRR